MVNEYFDLVSYDGTLEYYIFELANYSALAFLLLICYQLKFIQINALIVWLGLFLSPLLFNHFLFSPWLFGDQYQYASEVMSLKAGRGNINSVGTFFSDDATSAVTFASKILGAIPLPNFMTVTSLAFANKLLLFVTFLWFKRFFNNENEVLLYFLIPSLILYSSLGLRDTLIMILSIVFIINLLRRRYILPLLILYPLFTLKIQMFAILALYLLGSLVFQANRSKRFFSFFIIVFFSSSIVFQDQILTILNLYRIAFLAEDFVAYDGSISYQAWRMYGPENIDSLKLNSIFDIFYQSLMKVPVLLLMPLPWNWSNIFYPIQSIESCLLIYLFVRLSINKSIYKNYEFIFLTFILIVGLSIYSLIMANEGTFVRYRFTLFYPFLLGVFYLSSANIDNVKINHKTR